jgi:FlaA1/EpsC-like NDP-sugar epimerase
MVGEQHESLHKRSTLLKAVLTNLSETRRSRKQAVSIGVDATFATLSLWAAYSLRFGVPFSNFRATWHLFLALPALVVLVFMALGIYRWVVRSSNRLLFRRLAMACVVSSITLVMLVHLFPPDTKTPRSLFIIFGMLLVIMTCCARFVWQGLFDSGEHGEPVAIYGAGEAGRQLASSFQQSLDYRPVVFLDDNKSLMGSTLAGIPVIWTGVPLFERELISRGVERVVLAIPSLNASAYKQKLAMFKRAGLPVQTIPTYAELVGGKVPLTQVRDISINDILGRTEVPPDRSLLGHCVKGKAVMVTGGGGSIGSELCRQILAQGPSKLIVVDHSEANLYQITEELQAMQQASSLAGSRFISRLCSVNDHAGIMEIIQSNKVSTIYHAAAYKHVPIVEEQPEQGVRVNVFGTRNVLEAAIDCEVENFVLISTDKAVRPTNSMGATKRVAEMLLQSRALESHKTTISMVRFGNVLGSSGSVVPKFKKQIEEGGPITLTDMKVTRYFMTIPEAAQLVMQASAIAKGGDVFVLDMGKPIRIEDLATTMVRLAGKRLTRETGKASDIDIVVEGLRPGEKMFEELFIGNDFRQTEVTKVFTADEAWMPWAELQLCLDQLKSMADNQDRVALRAKLLDLAFFGHTDLPIRCTIPVTDVSLVARWRSGVLPSPVSS